LDAVASACDHIRSGHADLVITGGADSPTSALGVAAFCAAGIIPSLNGEDPRTVSRPFDRLRKGGIMAEGACILVVERLENAIARGAVPYLEFLGAGDSVDGPGTEGGSGFVHSMQEALNNSCLRPDDVDYVCAHGPSDLVLDRVETQSIRTVFRDRADGIPVSSIKGVTGNPLSAAGPMELAACAMMFGSGLIAPTANYTEADPACDLDYVGEGARRSRVRRALVNVHGLGGGNSSVVVARGPDA
jgi:3-oxoacyl-[acyl-carrier-protein] synthase II